MTEVTVTQADREAARALMVKLVAFLNTKGVKASAANLIGDDCDMRQAFACHRQSAEIAAIEAAKEACAKALFGKRRHLAARDIAMIQALSAHDIQKGLGR